MNAWDYKDDTPFIPVTLLGKDKDIRELALVDSGARLCVLHEDHKWTLDLDKINESYTTGFGSKKKIPVDICILSLEISDKIENIECIVLKEKYYPERLSRVVLGRNLLNKFKIILDGINKKTYLE
ncbi:MAG: hypothetical protein HYW23_02840 [Candidatus Aenigmarchaeota archaeon]|nr:hypothetical protein [Candidatus Aenigmarchaeota archaeon]